MSLFTGLPDQGFEDSDNSSIFSSPSPKSRQRAADPYSAELAQNSSVQLRQRTTRDDDVSVTVMGVQRQASHVPVGDKCVSPASELARPRSFVLSFPDETCAGEIVNSSNGQVLQCVLKHICIFLTWFCNLMLIIFLGHIDSAYCYRLSIMVCLLVCQSLSVTIVSPAKMAEPTEFWTWVDPRNHLLDRGLTPPCEGTILQRKEQPIVKYGDPLS